MKKINELINDLKSPEVRNDISNNLKEKQEEFLESTLGKIINTGIDVGIKAVLPDWLEDEIIEIKDSILNDGFKSGIQTTINKAIDMGKAIEGIFTGNFESISQIKSVIKVSIAEICRFLNYYVCERCNIERYFSIFIWVFDIG